MPEYARGFSVASAEFTPPYQKSGTTYYNIDDLTAYTPEKAESVLKEYNNYASQLLSIHEAVPGHCLQGIYNFGTSFYRNILAKLINFIVYREFITIKNHRM